MREAYPKRISSVALVVVAAACGSPGPSGNASRPTTPPPTRLELASTGAGPAPSVDAGPAIFPVRPTRYVLDAKLPDLGASAPVRRMDGHAVNEADVRRFADALHLAGSPVRTQTGWEVRATDATLTVDLSAATARVSYSPSAPSAVGGSTGSGVATTPGSAVAGGPATDTRPAEPPSPPTAATTVPPPAPPVDVPDAAEAQTIAQALLDRMGVLAGQRWSVAVNASGGVAIACPAGLPCPTVPPEVSARTVAFSLVLDGQRVDGIDWTVTIGEHRRIESVDGTWASPTTIGSYPLRSTVDTFADLQHGTARYAGPLPMIAAAGAPGAERSTIAPASGLPVVTVHVTGVSLGIARWDAYEPGRTVVDLVPTYRFHARTDPSAAYDIVVCALDPGTVTFMKPAPTPGPLPEVPAAPPTQPIRHG